MKRRTILKRVGAGSLLALTGVGTVSAAPPVESATKIRFADDRADIDLANFDPATADFDIQDCCYDENCDCPNCTCCYC